MGIHSMTESRNTWEEHYRNKQTPWDTGITPPEVVAFWQSGRLARAGLALDLGCGTATNVAYLRQLGLDAIGVEHAWSALQQGRQRLTERRLAAALVQADVSQLPFRGANASYLLDIGCFHGLFAEQRQGYVAGVVENLAVGGYFHLYAFDRVDELRNNPERAHRGVEEDEIIERFCPQLSVVEIVRANPDRYPCRWYLLRK